MSQVTYHKSFDAEDLRSLFCTHRVCSSIRAVNSRRCVALCAPVINSTPIIITFEDLDFSDSNSNAGFTFGDSSNVNRSLKLAVPSNGFLAPPHNNFHRPWSSSIAFH